LVTQLSEPVVVASDKFHRQTHNTIDSKVTVIA